MNIEWNYDSNLHYKFEDMRLIIQKLKGFLLFKINHPIHQS